MVTRTQTHDGTTSRSGGRMAGFAAAEARAVWTTARGLGPRTPPQAGGSHLPSSEERGAPSFRSALTQCFQVETGLGHTLGRTPGRGLAGRCLIQALPLRSCVALGKASRRLSLLICKQEENPYQPHASPWDQVRSITLSRRGPGGVSQASFLPQAWHPGEQRGGSRRSEPPHRPALSSQNMFAELKGIKNNLGSTLPFFLPVKPQQFARCSRTPLFTATLHAGAEPPESHRDGVLRGQPPRTGTGVADASAEAPGALCPPGSVKRPELIWVQATDGPPQDRFSGPWKSPRKQRHSTHNTHNLHDVPLQTTPPYRWGHCSPETQNSQVKALLLFFSF